MTKRRALAVLLVLCACTSRSPARPTAAEAPAELTAQVTAALRSRVPGVEVRQVDPLTLKVKANGQELQVNLDNTQARCGGDEAACAEAIEALVGNVEDSLAPQGEEVPLRAEQVRAVLKTRTYVEQGNVEFGRGSPAQGDAALLAEPWVGELMIVYVADLPRGMRLLVGKDLAQLGLERQALRTLAVENLRKAVGPLALQALQEPAGVYVLGTGDSYDAARLLLTDLWAPLAKQVDGKLVVVAPTRDVVFATGSKNATGLAGLRRAGEGLVATEAYPLSTQLLQWSPAGWTVFEAR